MSVHIIIDGYNLIRQSRTLSQMDQLDMETGRTALIDALAIYKRMKSHKITVVFDAHNVPASVMRRDRVKGIEVRFSDYGQLADAVIKNMVTKEREKATVVSSDLDVASYSAAHGAAVINSLAFEEKVTMATYMAMKGSEPEDETAPARRTSTRKKGPGRRLTKAQRRNQKKLNKL